MHPEGGNISDFKWEIVVFKGENFHHKGVNSHQDGANASSHPATLILYHLNLKGMKAENELTVQTKSLLEQKIEALTYRSRGAGRPARGARLCEGSAGVSTAGEGDGQKKIEELITCNAHLELEFKH